MRGVCKNIACMSNIPRTTIHPTVMMKPSARSTPTQPLLPTIRIPSAISSEGKHIDNPPCNNQCYHWQKQCDVAKQSGRNNRNHTPANFPTHSSNNMSKKNLGTYQVNVFRDLARPAMSGLLTNVVNKFLSNLEFAAHLHGMNPLRHSLRFPNSIR